LLVEFVEFFFVHDHVLLDVAEFLLEFLVGELEDAGWRLPLGALPIVVEQLKFSLLGAVLLQLLQVGPAGVLSVRQISLTPPVLLHRLGETFLQVPHLSAQFLDGFLLAGDFLLQGFLVFLALLLESA